MRPKARTEALIVETLPDETLVFDERANKVHCLNTTAAFVWRHCDGRRTPKEIARLLDADENVVHLALRQLEKRKLLDGGISRREAARKVAIGAGASILAPAVLSIIAPQPASAASCLASCSPCTVNSQCCSGHCNNTTVQGCQPVAGHQCT